MVHMEPSITAGQLLRSILTGLSVTITDISYALQKAGSDGQCQVLTTLTLDFHFTSSWESPKPPTDSASLPTDKVASSEVCLSMTELQNFVEYCAKWEPKFGSVLLDHIFDSITLTRILDTGLDGARFNMMRYSGENTSIVTLSGPSAFIVWLRSWMTYLSWPTKPEHWESQVFTSETSPTIETIVNTPGWKIVPLPSNESERT